MNTEVTAVRVLNEQEDVGITGTAPRSPAWDYVERRNALSELEV